MLKLIKSMFSSFLFVYKNMFHWIISKVFISISSYLLWIVLALPFFIISILLIWISPMELGNFIQGWEYLLWDALNNKIWFFIILIFFTLTIIFAFFWISYRILLLAKLNLKYLEKKKLKFLKNNYFKLSFIFKFLKISLIFLLIFLFFILLFSILLFIIISFYWGIDNLQSILNFSSINSFSTITLILFVVLFLLMLYIFYRMFFWFFIILENKDFTVKQSIKKSIQKTKKLSSLIKLLLLMIIFFVLLFPITYLWQYIKYEQNSLIKYIELKNKLHSEENKDTIKQNDFYTYKSLDINFWKYSNAELITKYKKMYSINIIFFIISYLLIFGLLDLLIANFYKREIKQIK